VDALQVRVINGLVSKLGRLFFLFREEGRVELVLAAVELNVEQLVDDVANFFSVAQGQGLGLDITHGLTSELFQVIDELVESLQCVAIVVFEVDKYAHFFCLSAKPSTESNES